MQTPSWDDDVREWRRCAGWLRQRLGEANQRAAAEAAAQGERVRRHIVRAEGRSRAWKERHQRLLDAKQRDGRMLDRLEELLLEGDVPAAIDALAERRAGIEAYRAQREAGR
jgi:hypothetical protein